METRPLADKTILVTRPEEGASRMSKMLMDLGACVRVAPMIRVAEPQDWSPVDAAIRVLDEYHRIIFTSANGPKFLAMRLAVLDVGPEAVPSDTSILAIGPATASSVEKHLGRMPDMAAGKYAAEGVVALFQDQNLAEERVLLARAKEGRDIIPKTLTEMGAFVDDVAVYRTMPLGRDALRGVWGELEAGKIDMLTFTSSSALNGFIWAAGVENAKRWMQRARMASIGPATSDTARKWGVEPDVEAVESTISGMAQAIGSYYEKPNRGGHALRTGA